MLFKKVRKLFTHRYDRDFDGNYRRDTYMDVLREIHAREHQDDTPKPAVYLSTRERSVDQ